MAQSECYHGTQQWCNYWTHAGHLEIEGLKMSKSLKNFTTIKEALARDASARQLRLLFLLQTWDGPMKYSHGGLAEAKDYEKTVQAFCAKVKALLRDDAKEITKQSQYLSPTEMALSEEIQGAWAKVHIALLDAGSATRSSLLKY